MSSNSDLDRQIEQLRKCEWAVSVFVGAGLGCLPTRTWTARSSSFENAS
eukprot:CAMPEP_0203763694 /NCGR_PEP_ID=MMETSP0098-20131031/16662_1 /ASSEMBLY_ACC=CAM_ASM_000208 /TAXON_ID=96639 /ORGANISM=" , Strain NY0313808BC1" /LENGTH=48 /DNA_ID= /DNA_START= /DNA_END= /DNA_ORIENTATION=